MCFVLAAIAENIGVLCLCDSHRQVADYLSLSGYCGSMSKTSAEERKARNAAFAALLDSLNPVPALRREMVTARKRAGLTQQELARRMRTTQSSIARLERGGRSPNIQTLRRMAEVTGSRLVVRLDADEMP